MDSRIIMRLATGIMSFTIVIILAINSYLSLTRGLALIDDNLRSMFNFVPILLINWIIAESDNDRDNNHQK